MALISGTKFCNEEQAIIPPTLGCGARGAAVVIPPNLSSN